MDDPRITRDSTLTRRRLLRGGVALGTAAVLGTGHASAQREFDGWFDDVSNYDGVVDKTGQSTVEVTVGAQANGGGFGFGPAAIRVDPGTTVVWTWNGEGGAHNVVATDDRYESDLLSDEGHLFEYTFESAGVSKYFCLPHRSLGMKGAVVIAEGDDAASVPEPEPNPGGMAITLGELAFVGAVLAGMLSPFAFGARAGSRGDGAVDDAPE